MNRKIISFCLMLSMLVLVFMPVGCSGKTVSERTGIIGAMEEEVATMKEAITDLKTTSVAGMEFYEGKLDGVNVVVVQCGMGKVNAGVCANTLINNFGCTKIINTGVAGSLDPQINIGDIVVSTDAVQHDFTVEAIGFQKGEIPYTGQFAFPADEAMHKSAVEAVRISAPAVKVFEGRVCTGDQFISSKEQRDKIISDFGGLCCEMEGGAIAQVCYLNKTPFVILRAISDKADESEEMNYEKFKEQAAKNCAAAVRYMVTH
ncbi:5'-methylthioadenosine/adenosylhomocysteine nucleosidase [[Clostridium] aminophilum]|uniref:adenosylhomocysteine nucleosidase n=1 Tax=[Clostridium] aminophilum TaxID=1526 RepID=A0A1I6IAH9_9FIRM|nr:5'-methylthioadenosine/adenosylhomocysteine nucleosidase [[Clostridium] aminophilum]SFR63696.1 adenosylhomocysteine nucleosidase [[Clostridium] aminophilum]